MANTKGANKPAPRSMGTKTATTGRSTGGSKTKAVAKQTKAKGATAGTRTAR